MSVKFNGVESDVFSLVGGGPQGSFSGMISYIIASNDNADHVPADDQYKYCDDLRILELVMIGGLLVEYDFTQHVASDIGIDQLFLPPTNCSTQQNIDRISLWTSHNLAKLNPEKSDYMIFTRAREQFSTRFQLEGKVLDRKYFIKLVGVWLQSDLGWAKNTSEILKKSYAKLGMLTKLKYAGISIPDLLTLYCSFIRCIPEYCSVAFHSSLTVEQSTSIELIQSTCLRVILADRYISYENALYITGLERLSVRRERKCLLFSLRAIQHPQNRRMFPYSDNDCNMDIRKKEIFKVKFARTESYKRSTIPYCQNLLNEYFLQA